MISIPFMSLCRFYALVSTKVGCDHIFKLRTKCRFVNDLAKSKRNKRDQQRTSASK